MKMFNYKGKTALITGASTGIGAVFARELAERGMNLILVARSADKMAALAEELKQRHKIQIEVLPIDLAIENAAEKVASEVERLKVSVDLLVNNAGFGMHGNFHELDAVEEHREAMLNVVTLLDLTHKFLPAMIAKGSGGVINVASTVAFQAVPLMATYAATKAFVLSFSEALWGEYKDSGVRILALCPGPVETPFFDNIPVQTAAYEGKDTPENVVRQGLRAFECNKNYVVPRTKEWVLANAVRFAPRFINIWILKTLMTPRKSMPQKLSFNN
jgi:uncharacterized protein